MLHELLLALAGGTGDFIVVEGEQRPALGLADGPSSSPTFKLAPDISLLRPSERSVIESLLPLGFYYRELDEFAASCRNSCSIVERSGVRLSPQISESSKGQRRPSAYRRAVANGIAEILSVYRAAALQVEQRLLKDCEPILATVTQRLNKHIRCCWSWGLSGQRRQSGQVQFHVLLPPLYVLLVEIEEDNIRGGQLLNLLYKQWYCGVPELQVCIQR